MNQSCASVAVEPAAAMDASPAISSSWVELEELDEGGRRLHFSLDGSAESSAAVRAIRWLAAQSDGHRHVMVFGGLQLDESPTSPPGSAIQSVDVLIQPQEAQTA